MHNTKPLLTDVLTIKSIRSGDLGLVLSHNEFSLVCENQTKDK